MNAGIPSYETAQILTSVRFMDTLGNVEDFLPQDLDFSYRKTTLPQALILSTRFRLSPAPKRLIEAKMKYLLKRRQSSQPLQKPNCGSVFKNPIEAAGLKGFSIGDAQISERHGNFILNHGAATASDCLALITKIQKDVAQQTGITLELEVKVIGRDAP